MKKVKQIINIIKYNIWTLIGFQMFFKIISLLIFSPLFLKLFNLIMKITRYNYLTLENIISFLANPLTIIMLIILIILVTIYTMFDITTIIIILDYSYQNKKINILESVSASIIKCKNLFNYKNIFLSFLVLFLIPFLDIGIKASFISTIKIPEFILDFIKQNNILLCIYIILKVLLSLLLLKWIYSLHYFTLENKNFRESRKKSIKLGKKKHIKDLITIYIVQIINVLAYLIFISIGIFIILFLNKFLKNIIIIKSLITTAIWIFIAISFIIFIVLTTPISYACVSILFYLHKQESNEIIKHVELKNNIKNKSINKVIKRCIPAVCILAFAFGTVFTYGIYKGKYNLNIEYARTMEITAHRGASTYYPENTMSSFIAAKQLGADWIELDLRQTKDGKVIVMHDSNFERTTGINKNTWELSLEEVSKLDAGYIFNPKFEGEKVLTLEETIEFAKKYGIKLNLELKKTKYDKDFEKTIIDIINEFDFKKDCIITSQSYEDLLNTKSYDKSIQTAYVMSIAYGDISNLDAADNFSIEASSITKSLVSSIHKSGKQVFAWTVNTKEGITKMIDLNVDNIITDDIVQAKNIVYSSKTSNLINEYVKYIEKLFY